MSRAIVISDDRENGRFLAATDGIEAYIKYVVMGDVVTFTHTFVPREFSGKGVATQLIRVALVHCRENGWNVMPFCPVVARYMKEHPETHDLLTGGARRLLFG